jgi:hypothetical protein
VLKRSNISWNLAGLPKGLYIVRAEGRRGDKYIKIIKR